VICTYTAWLEHMGSSSSGNVPRMIFGAGGLLASSAVQSQGSLWDDQQHGPSSEHACVSGLHRHGVQRTGHACMHAPRGEHACDALRRARSAAGAWVVANGRRVLNMVSLNFLGVAGDLVVNVRPPFPRPLLVRHGCDGLQRLWTLEPARRPMKHTASLGRPVKCSARQCAYVAGGVRGNSGQVRRGLMRAARLLWHHRCPSGAGGTSCVDIRLQHIVTVSNYKYGFLPLS